MRILVFEKAHFDRVEHAVNRAEALFVELKGTGLGEVLSQCARIDGRLGKKIEIHRLSMAQVKRNGRSTCEIEGLKPITGS